MSPVITTISRERGLFAVMRERLTNRPDTEHQAAIIRIVLALIGSCYLAIAIQTGMVADAERAHAIATIAFVLVYSVSTLTAILIKPQISIPRRITWIVIDNGAMTYALFFLGEVAIPFFGVHLFNICGNGFRFGQRYLYLASAVSIAGFILVLSISEYWLTNRILGVGLLMILVIIPLYFASLVRQLHATLAHMRNMATHDTLTGLPNRHSFYEQLQQILKLAEKNNTSFAVVFVDLDGFKPINDVLGHAAGDSILKSVATRLKECVHCNDVVARFGGDEFVIILSNVSKTIVPLVAQRIIDTVATPYEFDGRTITLSSSLGIATFPDSSRSADELVAYADTAMYRSKRSGKNYFCLDGESQTTSNLPTYPGECRAG